MKTKLFFTIIFLSAQLAFGQWVQQGSDIDGGATGDRFGYSISLSDDGNRVAIGGPQYDGMGGGNNIGHVQVFELTGGSWIPLGNEIPGVANLDESGISVSLNSDGTIVAIGANRNDGNGVDSGHVRIFELTGGSWIPLGNEIPGVADFDESGISVSLSSDGTIVAIGAPRHNGATGADSGHVRVFELTGGDWLPLGSEIEGVSAADLFGISVSLSSNGNRVAIGAYRNDDNGDDSGHVRVFELTGGNWLPLGSEIPGAAAGDRSGISVSLSNAGNRVAIGAYLNDDGGIDAGHVRVFELIGGNWELLGSEIPGEAANDFFGYSVSLSGDGNIVAIGAYQNDSNTGNSNDNRGRVQVYQFNGVNWNKIGADIDGETTDDQSGLPVSINSDGTSVAIGAFLNDGNTGNSNDNRGHVRVFSFNPDSDDSIVTLGNDSGINSTTGVQNVFVGDYSGFSNNEGSHNVFVGQQSGFSNTTGDNNIYIGQSSGHSNTIGNGNIFLGHHAGYNEMGSNRLYIDNSDTSSPLIWGDFENDLIQFNGEVSISTIPQDNTLNRILVTDASGNISWRDDTSLTPSIINFPSFPDSAGDGGGITNAYFGHEAGLSNTGGNNTFIGHQSGYNNTAGYENSGLGSLTLHSNTTGYRNTANGIYSLFANVTGNENTGVGYAALGFNTTGLGNTSIGVQSLVNNSNGAYNTAIGRGALTANTTGDANVAIGYNAGPDAGLTNLINTTAIGNGTVIYASNEIRLGNGAVTSIGGIVPWSVVSDGRFKKSIEEDVPGLDFITRLRPVSYELDGSGFQNLPTGESPKNMPETTPNAPQRTTGFVAQEVDQIIKENGYTFSGVERPQNERDHYSIRYSEFVVPLVKGMQEQQQIIEALQERIATLERLIYNTDSSTITGQTGNTENRTEGFVLYQNIPNPFDKTTTISAMVPERVKSARIIIYNLQGLELASYDLSGRGNASVEISGGVLPSGMYLYALIADGQVVNTKKMILTR